ncbi:dihydrofolate reductase family protein [Microlunatus spumicola]|uniref:Dihydrofolate reductase family protein n=1 Tax=Microlunatus spumicola TaxID=81499 RepID=A0ABP6YAY2_9ACTN
MTTDCHVSISLDGYLAGPDQSLDAPLGVGGQRMHAWHWPGTEPANEADAAATADLMTPRGAYVMGRNMFGPVRGPWASYDGEWRGWWGEEPPYRAPVFVLTHHAHEPLVMAGGTTFHFVTDGFDAAYARAREAAGDGDVRVTGGAATVRQAFAAGVLDEITLDVTPVLLGAGERLLDGVADPGLRLVDVTWSPAATHLRYRVGR